ncbi:hypothetical protein [Bacillus sp. 179-C3.3 HS]|uniref:hypothetical protein n=1 Tax=Bacillus sp. 179-C3.3 HS TaxID=3232162 RepID=UPI0039A09103
MLKRFLLVLSTLVMSVAVLLTAAMDSLGEHTISFEEPFILMLSVGMVVVLFIPPLVLSFFHHIVIRVISGIYQCFIVFSFLGLLPIGFLIPNGGLIILVSVIGFLVSVVSVIVTFLDSKSRNVEVKA